jgi:hypothetical protein
METDRQRAKKWVNYYWQQWGLGRGNALVEQRRNMDF